MAAEAAIAQETPDHGWIEKLVVWTIVLFAGQANVFTRSLDSWEMVISPVFYLLLHLVLAWHADVRFNRRYLFVIGGFTLYFALTTWKYQELHPRFWGIYSLYFTCAFIALSAMGMRVFLHVERVLSILAVIALFFWGIQLISPEMVQSLISHFEFVRSAVTSRGINGIVYSMQFTSATIPRNCGFAWEPGGFASVLLFGIFLNLIHSKSRLRGNQRLAVMIAALATTQSTTGWITAGILVVWVISQQRLWPIWLVMAMPVVILIMAHPMMGEKIQDAMEKDDQKVIVQAMDNAYEYQTTYTPQRFASFRLSWEDFKRNPLLGFGGHDQDSWGGREKIKIVVVTGLGEILRRFGSVGVLFFFCMAWYSSGRIAGSDAGRARLVLFGLIASVGFSYGQILLPFFMLFWMAGLFLDPRKPAICSQQVKATSIFPLHHASGAGAA